LALYDKVLAFAAHVFALALAAIKNLGLGLVKAKTKTVLPIDFLNHTYPLAYYRYSQFYSSSNIYKLFHSNIRFVKI